MSEKVLLVDDEKEFLDIMSERMQERGMTVKTADSADQAMAMLEKESFDAIVMDFKMPGMDGIQALKNIKTKKPELQIILLTGYATVEKTVEAMKIGATDLLEKPADLEKLAAKIKQAKAEKMLVVEKQTEDKIKDILKRFGG
ncbi:MULTISPECIES: response regulator [Desulfotignum]|jgi:DNA-binding NtrC family response regulator|uniref:Response regulator receiver protein n=1 Tax=Desulfotignum phosphitoxidans DSM 13687 TaxID=1286635 RepID=S0G713_9BACT|nr:MULTISPECIES: response regulator [Desulfotignum]EMS80752.1 response regulator receiver protein [Desulfotignum phosphitoxidans DSM 13687]